MPGMSARASGRPLDSGVVPDSGGEKWRNIDAALRYGLRGLPGGSSLARLLAEHRGVRNLMQLPPLTEEQILAWADAHYQRTGAWPTGKSGPVSEAPGETWRGVQMALHMGHAVCLADRGWLSSWPRSGPSGTSGLYRTSALSKSWPGQTAGTSGQAIGQTTNLDRFLKLPEKPGWPSTPP